jgi:hypothetical protein
MAVPLTILSVYAVAILSVWVFAIRDCVRTEVFSDGARRVWLVIVVLGPVLGSVAYLTARRCVQRFSLHDPERLARLLSKGV